MKRIVKIGLAGVLLASVFSAGAYAATVVPKVMIHGNIIQSKTTPIIIDGTVYVPLRTIPNILIVTPCFQEQALESNPLISNDIHMFKKANTTSGPY